LYLLMTIAMVGSFVQMHRRNHRSWEAIVARMSPECRSAWTAATSAQAEALYSLWMKTPRAAFRDAGVLMEMADYTDRNSPNSDPARVQFARSAALQLRLASAGAMIRRISLQ